MSASALQVASDVPFATALYWRLRMKGIHLEELTKQHRYERNYLAWETVRKQTNPFFDNGTGLEGYLIGHCQTPDEALETILNICQHMLDCIARYHRFDSNFQSRLFDTLIGYRNDAEAIETWSAYLGATLARLRCNLLNNRPADAFQTETYRLVDRHPDIDYKMRPETIKQHYRIAAAYTKTHRVQVNLSNLNPSHQDAWLVAASIGRFGHPLLRRVMDLEVL